MSEPAALVPAREPFNATLWAVRSPSAIVCFRVQVDAAGRVVRSSVPDFRALTEQADFDAQLRAALRARYGEATEVSVERDSGAGFARFLEDVSAGRNPTPPHARVTADRRHAQYQQHALWDP